MQNLLISSGTLLIGSSQASAMELKDAIKVSMLYNNIGRAEDLISEWGLSVLIESATEKVLFDTGGKSEVLLENMKASDTSLSKISKVVISHDHWDHVNGLDVFFEGELKPKIYVPLNSLEDIHYKFRNADLVGVDKPMKINDFIWSTGQLEANYGERKLFEQSIIIKDGNSVFLFTGCSHPGVVRIVEQTRRIINDEDIKLVAGGFHLNKHSEKQIYDISDKLKNLGVERIAPSHCTGDTALRIFHEEWEHDFVSFDLSSSAINL